MDQKQKLFSWAVELFLIKFTLGKKTPGGALKEEL
jgi:hypothetical protein